MTQPYRNVVFPSLIIVIIISVPSLLSPVSALAADPFVQKRQHMVEADLKSRGIGDARVLEIMGTVPRHLFVDEHLRDRAYADHPLPIDEGQTISQPYVVALMTETLKLKPSDRVLEIGTGSGYQAAVLAGIVGHVYTIEIRKKLADRASRKLTDLGYRNVKVRHGDGYFGWADEGPFDAIMITAAVNHIPPPLIKQLKEGGRIILPLGSTLYRQVLTLGVKRKGDLDIQQMGAVAFVPMVGEAQSPR